MLIALLLVSAAIINYCDNYCGISDEHCGMEKVNCRTKKVYCKQLIPELLQSGKHKHVARGLEILKYLATSRNSAVADQILKDATGGTHEIDCPICLVAIKNTDDLQILPCGHFYHDHCIISLYNTDYSHKCPLCKVEY
eukprot:NODE_415_length_9032_cov_0.580992.p5 type:complete len:139 gc:universal NODE_415_length_9032_cov_0.580992:4983-5399(+)